jgi:hypothetical protein
MTLVAQLRPRPTLTRRSACLPSIPDADYWMVWVSFAKLQLSADAEAVTWLRRGLESNHNYPLGHFHLAAAQALLGSQSEARAAAQAGLALDPTFTMRRYRAGASRGPKVRRLIFVDEPLLEATAPSARAGHLWHESISGKSLAWVLGENFKLFADGSWITACQRLHHDKVGNGSPRCVP